MNTHDAKATLHKIQRNGHLRLVPKSPEPLWKAALNLADETARSSPYWILVMFGVALGWCVWALLEWLDVIFRAK